MRTPTARLRPSGYSVRTSRIKIVHIQVLPLMTSVHKVSLDELAYLDRQRYDPIVICNYQWCLRVTQRVAHVGESLQVPREISGEVTDRMILLNVTDAS